jgi:hypothetical protein
MSCSNNNAAATSLTGSPPHDKSFSNVVTGNLNVTCESTSRQLLDLQLQINALINNSNSGGQSQSVLTKYTPRSYLISTMQPDVNIPDNAVPFTKTVDLGIVTTSAWVQFSVPFVNGGQLYAMTIDGLSGVSVNSSAQMPHTIYVTEDYTQTTRWSGVTVERNPITNDLVGFSTIKKSYAELGNFTFGIYSNISPVGSVVFGTDQNDGRAFYVRGVYLDNSGVTTRLTIDFVKVSTSPSNNAMFIDSNNLIIVYPVG